MAKLCNITFSGNFSKEGKYWITHCDQLPISAFGTSKEEAALKTAKALALYLETHNELGQLSEIIERYDLDVEPELGYTIKEQGFEARCPIPV